MVGERQNSAFQGARRESFDEGADLPSGFAVDIGADAPAPVRVSLEPDVIGFDSLYCAGARPWCMLHYRISLGPRLRQLLHTASRSSWGLLFWAACRSVSEGLIGAQGKANGTRLSRFVRLARPVTAGILLGGFEPSGRELLSGSAAPASANSHRGASAVA